MDTYGSPLAGRRRHRRRTWPPTRSSTRPGPSPPTSWRRPRTTSSSSTARSGCGARPDKAMPIQARGLRRLHRPRPARRHGAQPRRAQVTYDPPNFAFPFGTHVGRGRDRRGDRRGRAASTTSPSTTAATRSTRMIVEGQVHGGIVQGVAQALWEEAVYDDDGNLRNADAGRLPRAVGRRGPELHARPHGHARARPTRSGSRASARPARSARTPAVMNAIVDALVAARHHRHRHARLTRAGVGGDPAARRARRDPRRVRLRPGRLGRRGHRRCSPSTATRPSCWPAATRCCR